MTVKELLKYDIKTRFDSGLTYYEYYFYKQDYLYTLLKINPMFISSSPYGDYCSRLFNKHYFLKNWSADFLENNL